MWLYSHPQIKVPTGPKNPEIMEMLGFGFSHKQIEKIYMFKMEQNNSTELSGYLFNNMSHKTRPKNAKQSLNFVASFSPLLPCDAYVVFVLLWLEAHIFQGGTTLPDGGIGGRAAV